MYILNTGKNKWERRERREGKRMERRGEIQVNSLYANVSNCGNAYAHAFPCKTCRQLFIYMPRSVSVEVGGVCGSCAMLGIQGCHRRNHVIILAVGRCGFVDSGGYR